MAESSFYAGDIEGQIKELSGQIGELYRKSYLNNLTYNSNVTYVDGDVVTMLNDEVAIIQLRLDVSASMSGGEKVVENLPPTYGTNNTVIAFNNKNVGLFLANNSGQTASALTLSTGASLTSGTLIVNAVYLMAR